MNTKVVKEIGFIFFFVIIVATFGIGLADMLGISDKQFGREFMLDDNLGKTSFAMCFMVLIIFPLSKLFKR